jgi:hypothetical protein
MNEWVWSDSVTILKGKDKSTPITGHAGPEESRRVKAARFLDIGTIRW